MPRTTHAIPTYRRRRGRKYASGRREVDQAVVTINGHDHYLGPRGKACSSLPASPRFSPTAAGAGAVDHRAMGTAGNLP